MNTEVKRPGRITTREELILHIKAIGRAIIDDAEKIIPDPQNTTYISIFAEVNPLEQVTTVEYKLQRNTDPRLRRMK